MVERLEGFAGTRPGRGGWHGHRPFSPARPWADPWTGHRGASRAAPSADLRRSQPAPRPPASRLQPGRPSVSRDRGMGCPANQATVFIWGQRELELGCSLVSGNGSQHSQLGLCWSLGRVGAGEGWRPGEEQCSTWPASPGRALAPLLAGTPGRGRELPEPGRGRRD